MEMSPELKYTLTLVVVYSALFIIVLVLGVVGRRSRRKIRKYKKTKHMMATRAYHETSGNLSSETPELCVIHGERGDDYVGSWAEGFGFVDVMFPKATTRELNDEERTRYGGKVISLVKQEQCARIRRARINTSKN